MAGKRFELPGVFRNALILFSGSSVAQVIALALTPILSRIYTPEDFGILALFIGIAWFFGIVATLRYELAIMLPAEQKDAAGLVKLCFLISLLIAFISFTVIATMGDTIAELLKNDDIVPYLWLVPIVVLITGIFQTLNYWNTRRSEFKNVAAARIAQSVVVGGVQVSTSKVLSAGGLIIGYAAGIFAGAISLLFKTSKQDRAEWMSSTKSELNALAYKYKDFPRFNGIQAIVDSLQSSGVVFLISSFFGSIMLGWYSFTFRILQAPLGLIGSSIAQAFYQKAADNFNNGDDARSLFKTSLRTLFLVALPIFFLITIFAPVIFAFVFGENWREAGVYAQYLSPWLFMNFLVSPFSQLPMIVGRQGAMLSFSLVGNLLILLSLVVGAKFFNDLKIGFMILSATQTIYLSVLLYWYYSLSGRRANSTE
ncbi:MAG: oligosaccharide flippase family protein [Bacteroidia bacterium]|nr:oligosaccharide flippase family protein [Bacteroidia bacterium]